MRGLRSLYPCPICLIPRDKQSIWASEYPFGVMQSVVSEEVGRAAKENLLKRLGLRNVEVFFLKKKKTYIYKYN